MHKNCWQDCQLATLWCHRPVMDKLFKNRGREERWQAKNYLKQIIIKTKINSIFSQYYANVINKMISKSSTSYQLKKQYVPTFCTLLKTNVIGRRQVWT